MTKSTFTFAVPALAAFVLAGCTTGMTTPTTTTTVGGKNFNQLQSEYPDLTAVEFSLLDDNDDGLVSATEEMDIGDGTDELEVAEE